MAFFSASYCNVMDSFFNLERKKPVTRSCSSACGGFELQKKTLQSTVREKMAYVTQRKSIILYAVFHLISSLFICTIADVVSKCANTTICIGTYADIYKSLDSDVNSFNIEYALYPANEPSSVLVFVNLYGQNGTDKTGNDSVPDVMKYIWSLRSLYAAFPAVFLEISSFFSILVTPRTQELNITIPFFCCNVSVKDRKRMIKTALAALQDLAVTSGLRDPRLNFAESVIEGHIPDMKTTGRSYLRVVLWFSFLCPMFFGPFLYLWVLQYLKDDTQGISLSAGSDGNRRRVDYICRRNEEPLIRSVTLFCCFLLLIEVIFVLARVWTSTEISKRGNMSRDFMALLALIPECAMILRDLDVCH
nr:uncharacterized protein LOC131777645 [Pocillopora verrucosa]